MIRRCLVFAMLCTVPALAGPPLTTIQDVLYKADGSRFNGTVTISWSSFQAVDNSTILTQSTTVKVIDGNLRVQLVPNSTSVPATTYSVTYVSDGRYQIQETWSVPSSAHPLRVRDVRSLFGTGGTTGADTSDSSGPIPEANVVGLIADLGARPLKGPGYAAGRAVYINAVGQLEAISGAPTDCVRVDGSSGPCGNVVPSFVDNDSPAGIVDGANTVFTLSSVPDPVASLAVYRNGMLMKTGQDYTLAGGAINFVPLATPQPGDTLLASYRLTDPEGSGSAGVTVFTAPQVVCSGSSSAGGAVTCDIPAGLLAVGDRVEIRFDYAHLGSAAGFSVDVHWGATAVFHRDLPSSETLLSGRVDAAITASGSQMSTQSWGAAAGLLVSAAKAAEAYNQGVTVTFSASGAGGDSVELSNFSVVRLP